MAKKQTRAGATAETMAQKQREISVSEFFAKNRHLLGFDNPRKALLTTVKEAVDNALDACEEAGIPPEITVTIEEVGSSAAGGTNRVEEKGKGAARGSSRFRVTVLDNGPGIVRKQVEHIFGRLLYGSKFHRLKMSRGQQGIGISAAGMYGLMTTGRPMVINTRTSPRKKAHHIELAMDTTRNRPEVTVDRETDEFPATGTGTGTQVSIELEAKYTRGRTSVDEYLELTAIANPHAQITYVPPSKSAAAEGEEGARLIAETDAASARDGDGVVRTAELADRIVFPRTVEELPPETSEIRPHPYGVELGTFLQMLKGTEEKQLGGFLRSAFCRVTPGVAKEVYKAAGVTGQTWLKSLDHAAAEKVYHALQHANLRPPPTDCLAPIGVRTMLAGLLKGVRAEFYAAATRSPSVYRGMPFQIEAAIAFGGELPAEEPARVIRFANRVPLLYQQSACASVKSVLDTNWKAYGLGQPKGSLPVGPLVVMIHMASVWVPFTSESKEAIADYDEIRREMKLALQECGRKLGTYVRRRARMKREEERRGVFERYIGEIARSCEALTGTDAKRVYEALLKQARERTAIADAELDEEGRVVRKGDRFDSDDGVIIVDRGPEGPETGPAQSPASDAGSADRREPEEARKRRPSSAKRAGAPGGKRPAGRERRAATPAKPRMQLHLQPAPRETLFGEAS